MLTVTQATNKSTAVTLNKSQGRITLSNEALGAGAEATFTVNNNQVFAGDVVAINHRSGGTAGAYMIQANSIATGSFGVTVTNLSAGSLSEAIVIDYRVLRNDYA